MMDHGNSHKKLVRARFIVPIALCGAAWGVYGFGQLHSTKTYTGGELEGLHIVDSDKDGVATTSSGLSVRFLGVSNGTSDAWEHWWKLDGGPLDENPFPYAPQNGDQPPVINGNFRGISFQVSAKSPINVSYVGFIPGTPWHVLEPGEQLHNWDAPQTFELNQYNTVHKATFFADDISANQFLIGFAAGEWKNIDIVPNKLSLATKKGDVLAKGNWGVANVVRVPSDDRFVTSAKSIQPGISITLDPPKGLLTQELRIVPIDEKGKELPIFSRQNQAFIPNMMPVKPVRFEIQARPYEYIRYKDLHLDPDKKLWENIAWGPNQPTKKIEINGLSAELVAFASTKPGNQEWNKLQYVQKNLFTIDGHIWRGHPTELEGAVGPKSEMETVIDPVTRQMRHGHELPKPWFAVVKFLGVSKNEPKTEGQLELYGSDSDRPGEGLHLDWNQTPMFWNEYGQVRPIPETMWISFAMKPEAKFAQLKMEVATGPWVKAVEFAPDPNEIKPMGPEYRQYTLELNSKVHVQYLMPGNKRVDRVCDQTDLDGKQKRIFARLKSGARIPLAITAYHQYGASKSLSPSYDLDRDVNTTEGDVIALTDIAAFEVETRDIKTEYLVFAVPTKE